MASKFSAGLALFFLLASVAVLIAVAIVQVHKRSYESPGLRYGIVLDAGSSRTTVYLYQWPAEKENNTGVVNQTLRCLVDGPGISSFGQDAIQDQKTWNSMADCINRTKQAVPLDLQSSTPIFLGATAGMRLLRIQNETASDEILRSMEKYLRSLPFNFQNASIISGEEEGLYGWITANYLMGNFLERNLWNAWVRPHGAQTVGSLDLGGASTQIAFTAPLDEGIGTEGYTRVRLYGYEYNVYTHSFLCYGKNEAEKRVLAALAQSSSSTTVENPCFPVGFNTSMPAANIFGSPCTQQPPSYDPGQQLHLVGTGDPAGCRAIVQSIFDLASCHGRANCSFAGVYQPDISGDFMAYAGFYYTAAALKLGSSFTLEAFNSTAWAFCSTNWTSLKENYAIREIYLKSYCYSANYVYTLLVEGYKFTADTWNNIQFKKEVKKNSIAWSLGYMLTLSNMIPAEAKLLRLPMDNSVFAGLLFMFSALAILSLMFLIISLVRSCY
ncbi:ectonucleoside triphosphate diphosphohydrolase 3 [Megalops cyprinoides]|uniref:ectonucleoside triphosphate diphosphohydrolase 3 n=1 Tax=Megalops cyprinoides TaxID=118141 RepID=UPI0018650707|nr:ectonucleoside triphosphate diphosphohydrolase 3 [Megalops cyprinoides]